MKTTEKINNDIIINLPTNSNFGKQEFLKRKTFPLLFLAFFLSLAFTSVQAQNAGLAIKYLTIDYDTPTDGLFDDYTLATHGVELDIIKDLNSHFGIAVPFKFGTARVPANSGTFRNERMFGSLDLLAQYNILTSDYIFNPYLFAGGGATLEDRGVIDKNIVTANIPAGLGVNIKLGDHVFLNLQAEYRYAFRDNRDNTQLGAGLLFKFGESEPKEPKDRDGDGVIDKEDNCPDEVGPADNNGCPYQDRDGDGILDADDRCPEEVGPKENDGCPYQDRDGDGVLDADDRCPEEVGPKENNGCPYQDRDGDGVLDADDRCPDEVGPKDNNGCPYQDRDGDGVLDADDRCPDEVGPKDNNGCPLADRDGDGVVDSEDLCPNVPGTAALKGCTDADGDGVLSNIDKCPNMAGPATNQGCPEIEEKDKEVLKFAMRSVQFNTGQSTLKGSSAEVLDQVVGIMNKYPAYSLSISGHTDSSGGADNNQRLSERRAKTCFDFLVARGLDATRMSYVGVGESQPIADNNTSEGRALNRRTEFNIFLR